MVRQISLVHPVIVMGTGLKAQGTRHKKQDQKPRKSMFPERLILFLLLMTIVRFG